jgi:UDP-N-acetylmuramoylalanine--D-glutamate ligase
VTAGRVLVVGLRTTGDAVVRHFARAGTPIVVVEEHPDQPGFEGRVDAARRLGAQVVPAPPPEGWPELVAGSALVVPSPGVRPAHPVWAAAAAAGVPVRGDVDLGVELAPMPVVAVTGTNGKTTVTTLVAAMLDTSGVRAAAAGNIGDAVLDVLAASPPPEVLVVEVSSFQLHATSATFRPHVAVLTNVASDHLDWHGSFAEYAAVKGRVFAHQGPDDLLVANRDDPVVMELAAHAPGGVLACSGDDLAPGLRAVLDAGGWRAPHDRANAAVAAAAARAVGSTAAGEEHALATRTRLHHRVEPVGKAGGVEYLDDSKATNPHATLAAVSGFDRVVLLAGGDSKGVDLAALRPVADRLRAVVAIGDAPEEVEAAFAALVPTVRARSMDEAVTLAAARAEPGDVVLLSPACASYGWYRNYEERGDDFQRAVREHVLAGPGAA